MPKISVIVPVYNTQKYLSKCLDSIINQTYKDIEIICVDDGSTDNSLFILSEFAKKDTRIKIIQKENGGLVSARKRGIKEAACDYVAFVDSDDWAELDLMGDMYDLAEAYSADLVTVNHIVEVGETSFLKNHAFSEGLYDKKRLQNFIYPQMMSFGDEFFEIGIIPSFWGKLFKKELIADLLAGENEEIRIGEDVAVVYPALLKAKRLYISSKHLYHYRQDNNVSMMKSSETAEIECHRFIALHKNMMKYLDAHKELEESFIKHILYLMVQRADHLYKGISKLSYLFPFPNVKKGSDIVLYGAGTYGQRLYGWLKRTKFCNVLGWLDKNALSIKKQGLDVDLPDKLKEIYCDDIVVPAVFASTRAAIKRDIEAKYPNKRVHIIDEELLLSDETKRAFGLI